MSTHTCNIYMFMCNTQSVTNRMYMYVYKLVKIKTYYDKLLSGCADKHSIFIIILLLLFLRKLSFHYKNVIL